MNIIDLYLLNQFLKRPSLVVLCLHHFPFLLTLLARAMI